MRSLTSRALVLFVVLLTPSILLADNVTLSGTTSFAALDGSASDHDGLQNGVFTVDDGDLVISGTVDCNDDGGGAASACAMTFAVSGDLVISGALYAENRRGTGSGGAITLNVGRDLVVNAGAIISSASTSSSQSAGGDIIANVSRHVTLAAGSTLDSGAANARGGAIHIVAGGVVSLDGNVFSGPSRTLLAATRLNGQALQGGTANQIGGEIRISTSTFAEPALSVGSSANIISQGDQGGAGPVVLDGCGVSIKGHVAALSRADGAAQVSIRSGKDIVLDARDLGVAGPALGRNGRVRADAPSGTAANKGVDIFAAETIDLLGPASAASSLFPVTSLAGVQDPRSVGGSIRIVSTGEAVNASGNAIHAGRSAAGATGGAIEISAKNDVNLDTAVIASTGDSATNNPARGGGSIAVRAHSGNVIWTNGVGDVRPSGSGSRLPPGSQGTITLSACGTVDTTGSSFPVNGAATSVWPDVTTGACSPAAPSLPAGVDPLITCNTPPVANDAAASTNEDTSVTVTLSGSDADGDSLTFSIVSGPSNGSLGAITQVDSTSATVVYTPNKDFNGADSFVYQANDGNGGTDDATVTIAIAAVNDPPTFLAGPTAVSLEDAGEQSYANWATSISAGPADEAGQSVTFNVTTDNPSLFSVQPALAADGTLTWTSAADASGSATLTIVAHDDGGTANGGNDTSAAQSGTISITPVNDEPSFTGGGDVTIGEDSGAYSAAWASAISAGPNETQNLTFFASAADPSLFSVQPAVSPSGVLTFTTAADVNGSTSVSVYLMDDGGTSNGGDDTSAAQTFTISITSVNDAPSFTSGGDVTVDEDSASYSAAWASAISAGPADESGQSLTFSVANDNASLFSTAPSISPTGVLSFTVAADAFGAASVTVTLSDDGGTTNGGVDSSAPQSFTITVNAVNDAPTFTGGGDVAVDEDSGSYSAAWASAISAGPNEGGQTVAFQLANDNASLFSVAPSISPSGVLTFTLAPDANGVANVTVVLTDDGGTANGGFDTSAPQSFLITVNAINDPPTFTKGADQSVLEDSGAHTVAGWATNVSAGPADEAGQSVTFVVSATNPSLFSVQPAVSSNGDLTFTVAPDAFGTSTVTVTAQDNGGGSNTSAPQSFTITIVGVNDAPSFASGGDVTVDEDAGPQSIAWATSISAGPNEAGQTLTFVTSNSNTALFTAQPAMSASGVLTFTTASNAFGSATVTVYLMDDGGTANGGVATSATVTFTITVNAVNDPPIAAADAYDTIGNTLLQVAASQTVASPAVFVVGSVLSNDSDVDSAGTLTASLVSGSVTAGAVVTMNADGTFTYLPPAGHSAATDTFSYEVSDGSASAIGVVTITFKGRVWYVRNNGVAPGTGRSTEPFVLLNTASYVHPVQVSGSAETRRSGGAQSEKGVPIERSGVMTHSTSSANDTIFIFAGNGTTQFQDTGFRLQNGQRLLGEGVALTVPVSVNGGPNPTVLLPAGTKPKITNIGGSGVTGTAVSDVTVAGLEITGATGDGMTLTNASSVTVDTVAITSNLGSGISGSSVVGFSLTNSTIDGNGDDPAADEAGISFTNLTGTATISNSTIANSVETNMWIVNSAGVLDRVTFSNVTFGAVHATTGDDSLRIEAAGTSTVKVTITGSTFTSARGDLFQFNLPGNATGDLQMTGNAFSNNHGAILSGGGGIAITGGGGTNPTLTFNIAGNTFRDARGSALLLTKGSGTGTFTGTIDSNTIGISGVANSGSLEASGIELNVVGGGAITASVTNNRVLQYNNHGIFLSAGNATLGGSGALNATVTGNTVAEPASLSFVQNGFHLNVGLSSLGPDAHSACLTLSGNALAGSGRNGGTDFRLRQRFATTIRLPGYGGASNDNAAVAAFVQANNPGGETGAVQNNVSGGGGGFVGGAACPTP